MKSPVFIVLAVQNEAIKLHFKNAAEYAVETIARRQQRDIAILEWKNLDLAAVNGFGAAPHFKVEMPNRAFIFVADRFVSDRAPFQSTSFAEHCVRDNRGERVGLIGIVRQPQRVPDIDRTVSHACAPEKFCEELLHVIQRLDFLEKPARSSTPVPNNFFVRSLRNTHREFRDYFRLRQRIYTIMGYLDSETEQSTSQLEINEADTHAIHVGAFALGNQQERLVGSARVVMNGEENDALRAIFEAMAVRDPVIMDRLATPYTLGLPIFQSHYGMNAILEDVLSADVKCGELSRVIVDSEFRGLGLSRLLAQKAIDLALAQGTKRLFLECLEIHVPLYEQLGFRRLEGICGEVVDVGRTMVAMEMDNATLERRTNKLRPHAVQAQKPLPSRLSYLQQ